MKLCPKCNLSYTDDKKFCKECGDSLIDAAQENKGVIIIKKVISAVLVIIGLYLISGGFFNLFTSIFKQIESELFITNIILGSLLLLIGIGFLTGGYFLFKRRKKNVKKA